MQYTSIPILVCKPVITFVHLVITSHDLSLDLKVFQNQISVQIYVVKIKTEICICTLYNELIQLNWGVMERCLFFEL